jgi:hypothetical protein
MSATPKHPTAPDARGAHSLHRLVRPLFANARVNLFQLIQDCILKLRQLLFLDLVPAIYAVIFGLISSAILNSSLQAGPSFRVNMPLDSLRCVNKSRDALPNKCILGVGSREWRDCLCSLSDDAPSSNEAGNHIMEPLAGVLFLTVSEPLIPLELAPPSKAVTDEPTGNGENVSGNRESDGQINWPSWVWWRGWQWYHWVIWMFLSFFQGVGMCAIYDFLKPNK